jgi:hypothetical protein
LPLKASGDFCVFGRTLKHRVSTREGACDTSGASKSNIKYTFVNPNVDSEGIKAILRQIIIEKLSSESGDESIAS